GTGPPRGPPRPTWPSALAPLNPCLRCLVPAVMRFACSGAVPSRSRSARCATTPTLASMACFSFEIEDVFDLGVGFKGITLIGPPIETSGGLAVGDRLLVPTKDGGWAACECVEFPLVNLGPERAAWVRVSVTGVLPHDVQIGRRANRDS